jgi:hypothetical protein
MSELNKDNEVVQKGRKNALKDVDAPLRDQIVAKLLNKLSDMKVGNKVQNMWTSGNSNRAAWLERQQAYLASWDEHLISDTSGPFDGSSKLHIPMPHIVCKTFHARMMQAIWGIDPPFHVKARLEAMLERTQLVSDLLRYTLYDYANHNKGIEEVMDRWIWDWITTGLGVKKWRWDVTYTRFLDVTTETVPGPPKHVVIDGKDAQVPTTKQVEKEVAVTKKNFDGPVCELVNAEDFLTIGGSLDPDAADAVIHRQWLTASQLWTLADRGIFDTEAVEDVIEGGPDSESGQLNGAIKNQQLKNSGKASMDSDNDLDRYEILEAYLKVDVDGSGINSDIVVWVHNRSGEILRATYLYRVSKTGERPFATIEFHHRKGEAYPTGLVEMLYPLSRELDAIHNMRIDMGIISVMPFGFYRATSGIDPSKIQLEPGALIPVDNPQTDVYFPNLGNRTSFGMQEEQAIQNMVERLTSISDLNLGVMNGQGATRTATGARALVGEMSANLDVYLRRLNRGWKKSLRYLLHTLQQRVPPGLSFRLTGDAGSDYWRTIRDSKDIEGDFDLELSPNSSSSNKQIQTELAGQVLQQVQNPLAIQMGCVGPGQFYEALKNWYQANGVKDFGRYVIKPQGYERSITPEEEANRLLRGIEVPITPNMDHQGFIDYFQHIHDTDELLGQFDEHQTMLLAAQAQKHAQMAAALQQAAAQQANAQQMSRNAQMASNPMQGQAGPSSAPAAAPQQPQQFGQAGPGQVPG